MRLKTLRRFIVPLLLTAALFPRTTFSGERTLNLMWWNVENLFDTLDDPETEDDEFTPGGSKQWTKKKLLLKCIRLSHVVKSAATATGDYPDILAFAEVENEPVFRRMLSFLPRHHYRTAYHPSPDGRGIDIAVAYDSTRLRLLRTASWRVKFDGGRPSRDISLYRFEAETEQFFLLVNHWPSRSFDRSWTEQGRIAAAKTLRHVLDSLRTHERNPEIVVMGDFNDEPGDPSLSTVLGSTTDKAAFLLNPSGKLYNCWGESREKGSYRYRGRWQKLDQILLSEGMLDTAGLRLAENGFSCFHIPHMENGHGKEPWATHRGTVYLGGYSDHFPLLVRLTFP
ncbi:endonuclease [Prosthecochloris sp. GSB1]|uniref:endonuclease/exonuclease/phosphatase family protein n=1 Tax=Prosthecochloris sp. GSB1 TaxID=281093 RepID=UPI000B8D09AF|nr:endonuclease/exonuclease/phosphatase family protein [Prosthecochloris sp. GSB1]ASQ90294.1 endonuclease [Prosthecochloris sp. GSB1]